MFAQLFLGIYFVVKGIVEHYARKPNLFLSAAAIENIAKEDLASYLKKVGKTHIVLGIFVVTMGQIEYRYQPELGIFIMTYVIFGFSCIGIIAYLNKKYSGNYILRL